MLIAFFTVWLVVSVALAPLVGHVLFRRSR